MWLVYLFEKEGKELDDVFHWCRFMKTQREELLQLHRVSLA